MKLIAFGVGEKRGLAVETPGGQLHGLVIDEKNETSFAGEILELLSQGPEAIRDAERALREAPPVDPAGIAFLPPIASPPKIICVGLNYLDHAKESSFEAPTYPALFTRFNSTLVGHGDAIVKPRVSEQLDYEGELVVVIGKAGRHIPAKQALEHVAGYSIFNDASVRDYQFKSAQWIAGKNFDRTGGFGPCFVTADELPPGARGLKLQTRLNGQTVQNASTGDMIFDVVSLITILSEVLTLEVGDLIVSGTPAGVGFARKPPLFMSGGDNCEVEIEGIGVLRNPIVAEATQS